MTDPTERPRPTPDGSARAAARGDPGSIRAVIVRAEQTALPPAQPPAVDGATAQLAAAVNAVVTAGRVGRALTRTGWRIARQLPGARTVEREAHRLQGVAMAEARKLLVPEPVPPAGRRPMPPDVRVAAIVRTADTGPSPLRSAMSELLERSVEATRTDSREYLFGTIISQLVPDEARILAALGGGKHFAACDVVQKLRRGRERVLLAHASAVGRQAGLVSPDNVATYLTRLQGFGLVEFGLEDPALDVQYDILATDATVDRARQSVEPRKRGSVKLVRTTLRMSDFGRDFWAAADPSRPSLPAG